MKAFLRLFLTSILTLGLVFQCIAQQGGDDIKIGEFRTINSKALGEERLISLRFPKRYEESGMSYPVVYHLYGDRIDQYFAEAVTAVSNLAGDGAIPEVILVGIDEKQLRYRDLLPLGTDGSSTGIENFMKYLTEEAIPFVESNFRTKGYRIMVGPQVGANFGMYTLFKKPDLFDAYIITNPFRWRAGRQLLFDNMNSYIVEHQSLNKFLFITHEEDVHDVLGLEGNTFIDSLKQKLNEADLKGLEVQFNFVNDALATTSPTGLKRGLIALFDGYVIPNDIPINRLKDFQNYYEKLSDRLGFEIDIPDRALAMKSDELMGKQEFAAAEEILKHAEIVYPNGFNAMWRLGQLYRQIGEKEKAIDYYKRTMSLYPFIKEQAQIYIEQLSK